MLWLIRKTDEGMESESRTGKTHSSKDTPNIGVGANWVHSLTQDECS